MDIAGPAQKVFEKVSQEIIARSVRASNELRNASLRVFAGRRSGRRYRVPYTRGNFMKNRKKRTSHARYYTASAPGEAPAPRTSTLRRSWWPRPRSVAALGRTFAYPAIYSAMKYAWWLEKGTSRMAPRPFEDRIKRAAWAAIRRIYRQPYM